MSYKSILLLVFATVVLVQTVASEANITCQFTASANESTSIECPLKDVEVSWYKVGNEDKIESGDKYTVNKENQTLVIKKPGEDYCGVYKCVNGTESRDVTLCVFPYVKPYDKPKNVIEGDPFQTECVAWGYPSVGVQWQHMISDGTQKPVVAADGVIILKNGSCENSTLRIQSVRNEDAGVYICQVSSPIGSANATITVNVKDKLAALWPFLGICAEVAILCVIIFFYERRRAKRLEKEAASEESERMNVNNETRASEEVRHRK